jgi:hypothetical protein
MHSPVGFGNYGNVEYGFGASNTGFGTATSCEDLRRQADAARAESDAARTQLPMLLEISDENDPDYIEAQQLTNDKLRLSNELQAKAAAQCGGISLTSSGEAMSMETRLAIGGIALGALLIIVFALKS